MKRGILALLLLPLVALWAQQVDGTVDSGEYRIETASEQMRIYATDSQDSLFLACSAPTGGWVALGVGSMRMNGAAIFIGYVTDGKAEFRSDLGRGHNHRESDDFTVVSYALEETEGRTVLELELLKSGIPYSNPLKLLVGYGDKDDFRAYHRYRSALSLDL